MFQSSLQHQGAFHSSYGVSLISLTWLDDSVSWVPGAKPEIGSSIPLCASQEEGTCVALDELHGPRVPEAKTHGQQLLHTLHLSNVGKGYNSELPW